MKKIIIIFLSLLLNFSAQANDARINEFIDWLYKNGHTQYVKEVDICKVFLNVSIQTI